ncbi:MAG: hypothetical protein ACKO5I_07270, partial [Ignavibacteria bacterium]
NDPDYEDTDDGSSGESGDEDESGETLGEDTEQGEEEDGESDEVEEDLEENSEDDDQEGIVGNDSESVYGGNAPNQVHDVANLPQQQYSPPQRPPLQYTTSTPIMTSMRRPKVQWERLPSYLPSDVSVVSRDCVITYETMDGRRHLQDMSKEALQSNGIVSLLSFTKTGPGIMWQNRSSCKLHYETTSAYYHNVLAPQARSKGITPRLFLPNDGGSPQIVDDGTNVAIVMSGASYKNFHTKCQFREVIRDSCIASQFTIPRRDEGRQNNGPTIGLTSNQGTHRPKGSTYSEPQLTQGTHRYAELFGIISDFTRDILHDNRLTRRFSDLLSVARPGTKQRHYQNKADDIIPDNLYLSLSFKIYIHHPDSVVDHNQPFSIHRDENNPHHESPNDIMFTAWDTWFEPLLQLFVTGTIIACGRRSQEDLYDRICLTKAAYMAICRLQSQLPYHQKELVHDSIRIPEHRGDHTTTDNHILQTRPLTPNDYVYRTSMLLRHNGHGCLSAYLALEIVYIFHRNTTYPLRYHKFMSSFLESIRTTGDINEFLGPFTLVEKYQAFSFTEYANSQDECAPISCYTQNSNMHTLMKLLETAGKSPCSASRYNDLVRDIRRELHGVTEISAQHIIFNCASLGLFLSDAFMRFFLTSSTQQYHKLKQSPYLFKQRDQVNQLRTMLLIEQPHLLPIQADGIIATLTKTIPDNMKEFVYKGHSPYVASCDSRNRIVVERFNYHSLKLQNAKPVIFNYETYRSHYIPNWVQRRNGTSGNAFACLCSKLYHPSNRRKNGTRRACWAFLTSLIHNIIDYGADINVSKTMQTLFDYGTYYIMEDLEGQVEKHLGCNKGGLGPQISFMDERNGRGRCNIHDFAVLKSDLSLVGPDDVQRLPSHRRANFMLTDTVTGQYVDEPWARKAFLLNLLMNYSTSASTSSRNHTHWIKDHLTEHKPGFLLMIPASECGSYVLATTFIFLDPRDSQHNKVLCSHLDEKGQANKPFLLINLSQS